MPIKKQSKKIKLKEPVVVKDSLGDKGAKKLKETVKAKAAKDENVCPYCNYPDPEIKNGNYTCCGSPFIS